MNVPKPQCAAAQAAAGATEDVLTLVYNSKEKCMFLSPWHRLEPLRV